jgi:hypothetical protein
MEVNEFFLINKENGFLVGLLLWYNEDCKKQYNLSNDRAYDWSFGFWSD